MALSGTRGGRKEEIKEASKIGNKEENECVLADLDSEMLLSRGKESKDEGLRKKEG